MAQTYGGVVSLAIGLLPFLKVYAAGFFAIPLIRFIFNLNTNKGIGERNARRVLAFNRLKQMDPGESSCLFLSVPLVLVLASDFFSLHLLSFLWQR